jgi:hypothetical protein
LSLITKEVWINLSSNIKHYENLGYLIPRYKDKNGKFSVSKGTKLLVEVKDLSNGNRTKVDIECNGCGKKLKNITWRDYLKCVREDGKYYCSKCSMHLFGKENIKRTKLKNSKSFEQWCIESNRQDVLDRWDYELNECKPNEITYKNNHKYYFKCSRNLHESEPKCISHFVNGHEGCIECRDCNSFAQWGIDNICEDFLEKYWDYDKNNEIGINPWKIDYGYNKKVWIKCQEKDYHDSYDVSCNSFTNMNSRCPYCKHIKIHKLDSLGMSNPEVLKIWSDKNKKAPYNYSPSSAQKVWWKCLENKHEDYYRSINTSSTCNFRCPECVQERNESTLQEKIRIYLNELGYAILHEYNCNVKCINPKTEYQMPYDNEIEKLKLIIEVHGVQHYKKTNFCNLSAQKFNTTPEYEFHIQQVKDRYKRIFAEFKGYEYLEIPYWAEKNDEYKILIDDKIKSLVIA